MQTCSIFEDVSRRPGRLQMGPHNLTCWPLQAQAEEEAAPASRLPASSPPSVLSAPHVIATGLEGVVDPEAEEHEQPAGPEQRRCQPRCLDSPNYRMDHALAEAAHAASHAEHAAMGEHGPLAAVLAVPFATESWGVEGSGCNVRLRRNSLLHQVQSCHVVGLQENVCTVCTIACMVPHGAGHTLAEAAQAALGCCSGWGFV